LKINKKSWHYWLNDVTDSKLCSQLEWGNVGLCDYFWGTVKSFLKLVSFLVGCLIIGAVLLFGVYLVLNALVFIVTGIIGYPLSWVNMDNAIGTIVLTSLIGIISGFCLWLQDEINFLPEYVKIKTEPSPDKDKEPNLFKSYYSAWKDKICPLVELED